MRVLSYSAAHAGISAARLGENFGYRVEGDVVTLNADIEFYSPEILGCDWRLQLWACDDPYHGGYIQGIKIADVEIGEALTLTTLVHVESAVFANVPAGSQNHSMVMILATQENARFATIHDYANYPLTQSFLSPRMIGNVSYRFDGSRVKIDIDRVENPRDNHNISGTLAIELWAIPDRYEGGPFQGTGLAGIAIGALHGQQHLEDLTFDLPLNRNVEGQQYVVLMLREWTTKGYMTRDYSCFAKPVMFNINTAEAKQHRKVTKPGSSKITRTLIAALGGTLSLRKIRGKTNGSTVVVQTNINRAEQSVNAEDTLRNNVIRGRQRGRRALATLTAVSNFTRKSRMRTDNQSLSDTNSIVVT